jgi:hypothetical protein
MEKSNFFGNAVKYGLIIAFFSILLSLVYYIFDVEIFQISFIISNLIISLGITITLFIFGVKSYRKSLGGIIDFKQAFLQSLMIGLVAYTISAIYNFVFFGFIAPDYMSSQLDGFVEFMESFNMPEEALDKAIADFESKMAPMDQVWSGIKSGAIFTLILSLIVGLAIKKDTTQPEIV